MGRLPSRSGRIRPARRGDNIRDGSDNGPAGEAQGKARILQAIRLELRGLEEQLQASLKDLQASKERLDRNVADPPPYLVGMLRTTVFTSQLGKLSDLSDPLVYEVIKLYSEIPVLLEIIAVLNQNSKELARDDGSAQQARRMKAVASIVTALILQGDGFIGKIRNSGRGSTRVK